MTRRLYWAFVGALALLPAIARAQADGDVLAARLPADSTMLYVEVDVKGLLEGGQAFLSAIDEEVAESVAHQVAELREVVKEIAATHEFSPALMDKLSQVRGYFVIVMKDEPEVIVRQRRRYRFDEVATDIEAYAIPLQLDSDIMLDDWEEQTYEEKVYFVSSFVLEAPQEEDAVDFLEEVKALLDRQMEKDPELAFERVDHEVEQGELIGAPDGETVGRIGRYIVISERNPKELWAALMAQSDETVADLPGYRRLTAGEGPVHALVLVNLELVIRRSEQELADELEQARQETADAEEDGENWRLRFAQAQYDSFLLTKKLFSLDKMQQTGAILRFDSEDGGGNVGLLAVLALGNPISPVLEELLTGSGSFAPPSIGKPEAARAMARVKLKTIYLAVIETLTSSNPGAAEQFAAGMAAMKMEIGTDVGEILDMLASDVYLFVDVARKEVSRQRYEMDEETEEWKVVTEKREETVPEVTLLWALEDPQAARDTLSAVFATVSSKPYGAALVKKRTYQETDVYCLGMGVSDEESYPDGSSAYALAIVGRCVTTGSWESVTAIIRRIRSGQLQTDAGLAALVQEHPDSNLLILAPAALQRKLFDMVFFPEGADTDIFSFMLEELESEDFDVEDEELADRLRDVLRGLIGVARTLDAKARENLGDIRASGTHRGAFYEVESALEVAP